MASIVASGTALAVLVALLTIETVAPYFDFFRGRLQLRVTHALRNFALAALNLLPGIVVTTALWTGATQWAEQHRFGLLYYLPLTGAVRMGAALVVFDAWMYLWHRLNHRVHVLWRFHRVHHSDPYMDVTTANRFHAGEIALSGLARTLVLPVLGMTLTELVAYQTALYAIVQLHHANLRLPPKLDRALRWIVVTPDVHKVHHSRVQAETDSNYGTLFTWWDRLFRTLRLRTDPSDIRFGLHEFDAPRFQTLAGMLKTPVE